jgi:hypothetical protein
VVWRRRFPGGGLAATAGDSPAPAPARRRQPPAARRLRLAAGRRPPPAGSGSPAPAAVTVGSKLPARSGQDEGDGHDDEGDEETRP